MITLNPPPKFLCMQHISYVLRVYNVYYASVYGHINVYVYLYACVLCVVAYGVIYGFVRI